MSSLSAEWWRRWLCPELRATWEQCGSGAPGTATGRVEYTFNLTVWKAGRKEEATTQTVSTSNRDSLGGPCQGGMHMPPRMPLCLRHMPSGWARQGHQPGLSLSWYWSGLFISCPGVGDWDWEWGTGCSWPGCLMPASWDSLNYLPPLGCGKPWGFATQEQRKCVSSCSFHGAPTSPV